MEDDAKTDKKFLRAGSQFWLWLGLLLPVAAWAFQMQPNLILTHYACAVGSNLTLHLASLAAISLVVAGGFISWRNWLATGAEVPSEKAGALPRSRFLSLLSLLVGGLFFLLVIALWLPNLFMSAYEKLRQK